MPTVKRDYYEVLSVTRNANGDEIKRSYRKLAMQYHPDRNQGDGHAEAEARFKEAAEAYEVLSDEQKRARYDQYGHAGMQGQAHDYSGMDVGDIFSMFEDIFGGAFGGGRRGGGGGGQRAQSNRPTKGFDLETQVELTLSDVANGAEKSIEFEKNESCGQCKGSGAKPGTSPVVCVQCGGAGQVAQQGFGGMFRMVTTCPNCRGRGQVIKDFCATCGGTGKELKQATVTVRIPAGVHDGQAVRIANQGEPGENGGPPGDLHCYISVKQHPVFTRHNNDLVCHAPVSFTQAALGSTVEVPTLKGKHQLEIPAGTQHGEVFKLKGQGLPDVRSRKSGDEIVQILIEIPRKLSERQRQLLKEFSESEDVKSDQMPAKKTFRDKIKDMFN